MGEANVAFAVAFDLATAHMYFEIKEKHFDFSECI